MKHQIALVGGQLLPILIGIKEFVPDEIHLILSNETVDKIAGLTALLNTRQINKYNCDPFDFLSIKTTCEQIIAKLNSSDEVAFNLTGGTKIMVLALQAIIHEKNLQGFYINQDDTFLELPSYEKKKINSEILIDEFLALSSHTISSYKKIQDFDKDDFNTAHNIELFSSNNSYKTITTFFRNKYSANKKIIPLEGKDTINNTCEIFWTHNTIKASQNGSPLMEFKSKNVNNLFFNAGWWELLVAEKVSKWNEVREILLQCELPFKTDKNVTKNEIDILVNLGRKLLFIECKSGSVKQEDINKMKVIKDTYGGIIAKSLLVCRYMPPPSIIEKCKELNIELFYCYMGKHKINSIDKLLNLLNKVEKRMSV